METVNDSMLRTWNRKSNILDEVRRNRGRGPQREDADSEGGYYGRGIPEKEEIMEQVFPKDHLEPLNH